MSGVEASVIMPVYNGERYLPEAIKSILNQTLKNFELLILDDCSTDNSERVIRTFTDQRIRIIANEKNLGLVGTLNIGFGQARGKYIARMDQDDYADATRLKKQVDFLEHHPDVGVLGTTTYIMNKTGAVVGMSPSLLHDQELKLQLLYQTPFSHGSIMLRRDVLANLEPPYYDQAAGNAEDYDLWSRLAPVTKFANLPEPLYGWRDNPTGMSNSESEKQRRFADRNSRSNLRSPYLRRLLQTFIPNPSGYENARVNVRGQSVWCNRRDSYAYFLFRLALATWNGGFRKRSAPLLLKALLANPKYFVRAAFTGND